MHLTGRCHCGALSASLETGLDADAIEVRADGCSFCTARGVKTVSDPHGKLILRFDGTGAHAYRFGFKAADFWLCNGCGAFAAATTEIDGRLFGVLNVAGMCVDPLAGRTAKIVDFSSEDPASRDARRAARWTPTQILR